MTPMIAHNRIYFCQHTMVCHPSQQRAPPLSHSVTPTPNFSRRSLLLFASPPSKKPKTMADRNSRSSVKKKEKKVESKANEDKEQNLKKIDKLVKKADVPRNEGEKRSMESEGATGAEAQNSEGNGEFQPIELPPFEIVTGWVWFNTQKFKLPIFTTLHSTVLHFSDLQLSVSYVFEVHFYISETFALLSISVNTNAIDAHLLFFYLGSKNRHESQNRVDALSLHLVLVPLHSLLHSLAIYIGCKTTDIKNKCRRSSFEATGLLAILKKLHLCLQASFVLRNRWEVLFSFVVYIKMNWTTDNLHILR